MQALQEYSSDESGSGDEDNTQLEDYTAHLKPMESEHSVIGTQVLNAAPLVVTKVWKSRLILIIGWSLMIPSTSCFFILTVIRKVSQKLSN